jgi:hypothetical protein
MSVPADLREIVFDRLVDRLVRRLGTRAVAELLRRLAQKHMIRTSIDTELERFVEHLTPGMLEATGGDRNRPTPIHLVRQ